MRKLVILLAACLGVLAACNKTPEPVNIVGEWQLSGYQTKAITIGSEKVDVYVKFTSDNAFEMYQMLGNGRYRKFTGTYALSADNLLTGKYSGGSAWAASYDVSLEGSKLMLTQHPDASEVHTFSSTTIPDSVKENIY